MTIGVYEAATLLGVSADTIYRYANDGVIPAFKPGGKWRFRRDLLEKWMHEESRKGMVRRGA